MNSIAEVPKVTTQPPPAPLPIQQPLKPPPATPPEKDKHPIADKWWAYPDPWE